MSLLFVGRTNITFLQEEVQILQRNFVRRKFHQTCTSSCLVSEGWKRYELWYFFFLPWYLSSPPKKLASSLLPANGPKVRWIEGRRFGWFCKPGIICFLQKDPHGWKFSFTGVFPTNRFFHAVMSMIWNVLRLKLYPSIRRMSSSIAGSRGLSLSQNIVLQPRFPCFTVDANTFTASDEISPPNVVIFRWRVLFSPVLFHKFCQTCHGFKIVKHLLQGGLVRQMIQVQREGSIFRCVLRWVVQEPFPSGFTHQYSNHIATNSI